MDPDGVTGNFYAESLTIHEMPICTLHQPKTYPRMVEAGEWDLLNFKEGVYYDPSNSKGLNQRKKKSQFLRLS